MRCFLCGSEDNVSHKIFGDHDVCENCYRGKNYYNCYYCSNKIPSSMIDEIYDSVDDEYYNCCPECYRDERGKYPHDYKPYPIFHSLFNADRKHCLHIGAELEIQLQHYSEFICDFNKEIDEDKFYLKYDGSLDDEEGIEIVSHPMTLPIALKEWNKLFTLINNYPYNHLDGCGLHIHLDNEYLSERQIRNIDYIINTFTDSVKKFGGRDIVHHEWASHIIKNREEWGHVTIEDYKYRAVNFCENTLELRCFDSTDDWFNFRYIIIGVFALVEMASIHTLNYFENMNDSEFWLTFKTYISKYAKRNNI